MKMNRSLNNLFAVVNELNAINTDIVLSTVSSTKLCFSVTAPGSSKVALISTAGESTSECMVTLKTQQHGGVAEYSRPVIDPIADAVRIIDYLK